MPLRHFGQYRDVTPEQAKLDKVAIKTLFRWGVTQESELAAKCKTRLANDDWKESLVRLQYYNLVEVFDRRQSKYVRLTADGQGWGMDLTCEEQEVPPGTPADHAKMAAEKQ
jgi:hypothetical protein